MDYRHIADLQFAAHCRPCHLDRQKADRGITFSSFGAICLRHDYSSRSAAIGPRATGDRNMEPLVMEF